MSDTDLMNQALDLLGEAPIDTASEATARGRLLRRNLDRAVCLVLEQGHWGAASTTACLTRLKIDPDECPLPAPYCAAYALPTDPCPLLRAIRVTGKNGCKVNWKRGTVKIDGAPVGAILVDQGDDALMIEYVFRPTDLCDLPKTLQDVIATRLAGLLVQSLRADKSHQQMIEALYDRALGEALLIDAVQDQGETDLIESEVLLARMGF